MYGGQKGGLLYLKSCYSAFLTARAIDAIVLLEDKYLIWSQYCKLFALAVALRTYVLIKDL